MNESIIAVRYAKALHQLAKEHGATQSVFNDMTNLLEITYEMPEFQKFLDSPVIKTKMKLEIIFRSFNTFQKLTLSFLTTLFNNRREFILPDIARKYISVINKEEKTTVATFTSTFTLADDIKQQIIQLVTKKYNANRVLLESKTDDRLIGGFILKINDQQLDSSIATQLDELKRKLLKTPVK